MQSDNVKSPAFEAQDIYSVIEGVSARIVVFPAPDRVYLSGSCFRIARNLYVTAKHVVTDYLDQFGMTDGIASFEMWAIHIQAGPEYSIWMVDRLWLCPLSDLAVFHTKPYNDIAMADRNILCAGLELVPPRIGDRVVGFGHHTPSGNVKYGEDGTRHIEVNASGAAAVGEVCEIHHERRDSVRLSFPCFRTNSRFDGGMSGGPVLSDRGKVCGVICSHLPPFYENDSHISYAASLWPLMSTMIDLKTDGTTASQPYPILDLAKAGVICAEGWRRVSIQGTLQGGDLEIKIEKYLD